MKDAIIKADRHRMGTDGCGVSTLVVFHGCPLNCKYCINNFCHDENIRCRNLTPEELLAQVKIDEIYFRMTGGGIVFGGGEPVLHSKYIAEFIKIAPKEWDYRMETSLNAKWEHVKQLIPYIDSWIIDIKDMNPEIYKQYTGMDNKKVIANIRKLSEQVEPSKIHFRIPLIAGYNTEEDRKKSEAVLEKYGAVEKFSYMIPKQKNQY